MNGYDYENLVANLKTHILLVTFEKVDGSMREMACTLMDKYLPEHDRELAAKGAMLTETTPNNISVWDVDANGWRSFRIDSVQSVAFQV